MKITKENAMLIDIQYVQANRKAGTPDYLYIIWKDLDSGEKYLQKMTEPPMDIYFEKPEYRNHKNVLGWQYLDRVNKKTVKAKDIIRAIAEDMGEEGEIKLNDAFTTKNYRMLREFFLYPYVYGADYDVRVFYRQKWRELFDNDRVKKITKGFLDIEVDIMEADGMPNPDLHPIDLITLIDTSTNTSYTFALTGVECVERPYESLKTVEERDKEYVRRMDYKNRIELQNEVMNDVDGLYEKIHDMYDENYPDMNYNVYFYKDERKMLIHLFQLINNLKLDFIGIWNMSFDIHYIINRLKALGLDPAEVMCHPDFPVKECYFKKDKFNFEIKNKSDFFHCSSYTIFFDQMILYAALRKGREELRSYKLTYIAKKEIRDEKLDYSEEGDLKRLSSKDYVKYILYNIKDVLLQTGIERKTTDLDTYYIYSYNNITQYENVFKQTVKLRNVQYRSYLKDNIIPGENVNGFLHALDVVSAKETDENKSKFEGALVGNPLLINYFGDMLFGKQTRNIFLFSIDMDMSAFYPNSITVMNIDASCLIFKVIISPYQYDVLGGKIPYHGITNVQMVKGNRNTFMEDLGKEVFDNFQTGDMISTMHKWMNAPSALEVYEELKKRLG